MSVTDDYMHFSDFKNFARTFSATGVTVYKVLYTAADPHFLKVLSCKELVKMHIFFLGVS